MFQGKLARDVTFSNDGKKMFVTGNTGDDVNEYTLSEAFNISSAVFVDSFQSSEDTRPTELGLTMMIKMFIIGRDENKVFEYSLSVNLMYQSKLYWKFF